MSGRGLKPLWNYREFLKPPIFLPEVVSGRGLKPLWNYRKFFKPLIFLPEVVWREVRKDVLSVKRFTEFVWTESWFLYVRIRISRWGLSVMQIYKVQPRYNEPLYNEDLGITNDFLYPRHSKIYEKNLDIANKFCHFPWPFVISRFHCRFKIVSPSKFDLVMAGHALALLFMSL